MAFPVPSPYFRRSRPVYALLVTLVLGAGLLWRSHFFPLPKFASKYGGDGLWALLVFFGFGFLFYRASTQRIALLALTFAWCIEFSQMYHAQWIHALRATRIGRLILGSTFNYPDLFAYLGGISIGAFLELLFHKRLLSSR